MINKKIGKPKIKMIEPMQNVIAKIDLAPQLALNENELRLRIYRTCQKIVGWLRIMTMTFSI